MQPIFTSISRPRHDFFLDPRIIERNAMSTPKPKLSMLQICNMSIGFMGIQFGWGLQMANMSAIYEYLGANPDSIPVLWLAAPLTGLIVQPIIGHMSDTTWGRLGRRRPYFLAGAILASIALFLMPYSGVLFMAAGLLWILDTCVNVSMEPFRAFVADMLPEEQRTVGYSIQTLFVSLGAVTASAFPFILEHVFGVGSVPATEPAVDALATTLPAHGTVYYLVSSFPALGHFMADSLPSIIKIAFHTGAAVFFFCVLWTVVTCKEYPPENLEEFRRRKAESAGFTRLLPEILRALKGMPRTMRELALVQFFSWAGFFCMWMYFPIAVGHRFGTEGTPEYLQGVEWAGLCFAAYNAITLIYSFFLPRLAARIGLKGAHIFGLLCISMAMIGVFFTHGKWDVMVLMIGIGIGWGSVLTIPYAILSCSLPKERMGIYMGIFNFFITLPQIVISLGFGWVMQHVLQNERTLGVVFGGACFLLAALAMLRVHPASVDLNPGRASSGEQTI